MSRVHFALAAGLLATAPSASDYATQWSLDLAGADAGAYAVVLDDTVYRQARTPALADVDVLDAAGATVPAQLMRTGDGGRGEPPRVPLRWFALPDARDRQDRWSMAVERAADGSVLRVQAADATGGGATAEAWLVDASGLDAPIEALHLEWAAGEDGIDRAYRVEASDDLRAWRPVQAQAQLVDLARAGERLLQRRVPVGADARYLRLLPGQGQGSPRLQSVQAELASPDRRAPLQWRELEGTPLQEPAATARLFELDGRFPVEVADLQYAGNGTGQWRLYSREHADASWTLRAGPWVAYAIGSGEGANRSAPQPLTGITRDRQWKLVGARNDASTPRLRLGWRPEAVVFIAAGTPPYRLVAGSARAQRAGAPVAQSLEAIRATRGSAWQPGLATLSASRVLAGADALQPPAQPRDWRGWLLWALLVGGALLVAALAASLLRKPRA